MDHKESPRSNILLLIAFIVLFLTSSNYFWKNYASGRILNKDGKPIPKTKICILIYNQKYCETTNRYGRFHIKIHLDNKAKMNLILPELTKEIFEYKNTHKKIFGFSSIDDFGDIVIK